MEGADLIAAEILARTGLEPPIDAYQLCAAAGYDVRLAPAATRPTLLGRTVFVPAGKPPEWQRFAVLHELAHVILRARDIPDRESQVNALASSLLLPAELFRRDLAELGWNVPELKRRHPYASHEAISRRVVSLCEAVLWVCDRGPATRAQYRVRSQGVGGALTQVTPYEWRAVSEAARTLMPSRVAECVTAWPLENPEARWLRVLCLSDAAGLARASSP